MKKAAWWLLGGLAAFALYMATKSGFERIKTVLSSFLPSVEGFSSTPYWDVSRWSWGYGTAAPGSTGTITRSQAMSDLLTHVATDYAYLAPLVTKKLNANQWAAYLSFSYNLGTGNADNLLDNINSGDQDALGQQWAKYIYSGGSVNSDLVARRSKEWALWNTV